MSLFTLVEASVKPASSPVPTIAMAFRRAMSFALQQRDSSCSKSAIFLPCTSPRPLSVRSKVIYSIAYHRPRLTDNRGERRPASWKALLPLTGAQLRPTNSLILVYSTSLFARYLTIHCSRREVNLIGITRGCRERRAHTCTSQARVRRVPKLPAALRRQASVPLRLKTTVASMLPDFGGKFPMNVCHITTRILTLKLRRGLCQNFFIQQYLK